MNNYHRIKIKLKNRIDIYVIKKYLLIIFLALDIIMPLLLFNFVGRISKNLVELIFFKKMWICYFGLPISIFSIFYGIKCNKRGYGDCKVNIVVGILSSIILFILGSSTIIYVLNKDYYQYDYSYVTKLKKIIDFELPDNGNIITSKLSNNSTNDYKLISRSYINYSNSKDKKELEEKIIDSYLWNNNNNLQSIAPFVIKNENMYYLIFNYDQKTYNTLPNKSGEYKFYCLEYNMYEHELIIYEYKLNYNS
jgi:hypothetical protein